MNSLKASVAKTRVFDLLGLFWVYRPRLNPIRENVSFSAKQPHFQSGRERGLVNISNFRFFPFNGGYGRESKHKIFNGIGDEVVEIQPHYLVTVASEPDPNFGMWIQRPRSVYCMALLGPGTDLQPDDQMSVS